VVLYLLSVLLVPRLWLQEVFIVLPLPSLLVLQQGAGIKLLFILLVHFLVEELEILLDLTDSVQDLCIVVCNLVHFIFNFQLGFFVIRDIVAAPQKTIDVSQILRDLVRSLRSALLGPVLL
jgi:hypothetical protein